MLNNPFGNIEYPLPADNMVFRDNNSTRSKGLDESLMNPIDNSQEYVGKATTMLDPEMKSGKPENDNQHDVFDDIMNEMMKQEENNGMVPVATRFGFDSFPPP
ncbi:Two-component response regulator ARR18 [Arabidopsis thaliana]